MSKEPKLSKASVSKVAVKYLSEQIRANANSPINLLALADKIDLLYEVKPKEDEKPVEVVEPKPEKESK